MKLFRFKRAVDPADGEIRAAEDGALASSLGKGHLGGSGPDGVAPLAIPQASGPWGPESWPGRNQCW